MALTTGPGCSKVGWRYPLVDSALRFATIDVFPWKLLKPQALAPILFTNFLIRTIMRFTFDKTLDYSQSRWAKENSKEKTNCAKRGKTQVTRSHLIGWESGGKFSRPITVGSKVQPLQHRISFKIQLKISLYTDTYELKRINFNDKRILYLFVIREWRRWRSNRPAFLHTLCRG